MLDPIYGYIRFKIGEMPDKALIGLTLNVVNKEAEFLEEFFGEELFRPALKCTITYEAPPPSKRVDS